MTRRHFTAHPLVLRCAEVRDIRDITPRMRRITVGGPELGAFQKDGLSHPPFLAPGFDDHLKLVFSEGDVAPALPLQLAHGIEWTPSETRRARDYTPRRVGDGEIDLDFVLHGDGIASRWAQDARAGDALWFVGPKSSTILPEDLSWILLAGDETALPAIGRFLDERPTGAHATVIVTIADDAARQDLRLGPRDRIEWVIADPADREALDAAVRRLDLASRDDAAEGYAWCAAESKALLPLRRHFAQDVGLAKDRLNITGYWHHDDAHTAEDAEPVDGDASHAPVPSPRAWFVVRAALRLGLLDAVAAHPGSSLATLAARIGVETRALGPLLHDLRAHGALTGSDDALRLGPFGEELLGDEHEREEFDGLDADILASLDGLAEALRSRRPAWRVRTGVGFSDHAAEDAELQGELQEAGEQLSYLVDGLMAHPVWESASRCLLTGPGSAAVAQAVRERRPQTRVTIAEQPAALEALRAGLGDSADLIPLDDVSTADAADLVVLARSLGHRTDDEAADLLRRVAGVAPTALVVEPSRHDALSGPSARTELSHLALTGAPLRDADAIAAIAAIAGWRLEQVVPLGWGVEAVVLTAG